MMLFPPQSLASTKMMVPLLFLLRFHANPHEIRFQLCFRGYKLANVLKLGLRIQPFLHLGAWDQSQSQKNMNSVDVLWT